MNPTEELARITGVLSTTCKNPYLHYPRTLNLIQDLWHCLCPWATATPLPTLLTVSLSTLHQEVIMHSDHSYSIWLPIKIPYQLFPSYMSSTTLIPCCPPHQTFFGLFLVSILVFPCSSHCDIIMFNIISTAYRTAWQVKWRPMDSQSQCSGLWADWGFLAVFCLFEVP